MSIERTMDSSNLIGGEQKFVCLTKGFLIRGQWTMASKTFKVRSPILWVYGGFYIVYYKDVGEF
jgi:hypothetical protein